MARGGRGDSRWAKRKGEVGREKDRERGGIERTLSTTIVGSKASRHRGNMRCDRVVYQPRNHDRDAESIPAEQITSPCFLPSLSPRENHSMHTLEAEN